MRSQQDSGSPRATLFSEAKPRKIDLLDVKWKIVGFHNCILSTCFTIPMQTIIKIKAILIIISNFYLKMNNYDLFKITPTFYPQIDRYCKVFWIRVYWIIYKCNWRRCIIMLNFLNCVSFLANYTPITWDVSANIRHIPLHAGTFHWFFIIIL